MTFWILKMDNPPGKLEGFFSNQNILIPVSSLRCILSGSFALVLSSIHLSCIIYC
jgi:hypothetical protein